MNGNRSVLKDDIPQVLRQLHERAEREERLDDVSSEDLELRAEQDDSAAVAELCRRINVGEDIWPSDEERQKWESHRNGERLETWDEEWEVYSPEMFSALRHAAEENKPWAQKGLIDAYANPDSPEFNPAEAMRWCAKAASHGRPELVDIPLAEIARSLHKQALETQKYREAALQGDAEAQFQLGFVYHDGQGVDKDERLAIQWWSRAAENGLERAAKRLAELENPDNI